MRSILCHRRPLVLLTLLIASVLTPHFAHAVPLNDMDVAVGLQARQTPETVVIVIVEKSVEVETLMVAPATIAPPAAAAPAATTTQDATNTDNTNNALMASNPGDMSTTTASAVVAAVTSVAPQVVPTTPAAAVAGSGTGGLSVEVTITTSVNTDCWEEGGGVAAQMNFQVTVNGQNPTADGAGLPTLTFTFNAANTPLMIESADVWNAPGYTSSGYQVTVPISEGTYAGGNFHFAPSSPVRCEAQMEPAVVVGVTAIIGGVDVPVTVY